MKYQFSLNASTIALLVLFMQLVILLFCSQFIAVWSKKNPPNVEAVGVFLNSFVHPNGGLKTVEAEQAVQSYALR